MLRSACALAVVLTFLAVALGAPLQVAQADQPGPSLQNGCFVQGAYLWCPPTDPYNYTYNLTLPAHVTFVWEGTPGTLSGFGASTTCGVIGTCEIGSHFSPGPITVTVTGQPITISVDGISTSSTASSFGFIYVYVEPDASPAGTVTPGSIRDCGWVLNCSFVGGTLSTPPTEWHIWSGPGSLNSSSWGSTDGWGTHIGCGYYDNSPSTWTDPNDPFGGGGSCEQVSFYQSFTAPVSGEYYFMGDALDDGFGDCGSAVLDPSNNVLVGWHGCRTWTQGGAPIDYGHLTQGQSYSMVIVTNHSEHWDGNAGWVVPDAGTSDPACQSISYCTGGGAPGPTATPDVQASATAAFSATATQAAQDGATVIAAVTATADVSATIAAGYTPTPVGGNDAAATATAAAIATQGWDSFTPVPSTPLAYLTPDAPGTPVDTGTVESCTNFLCTCLQVAAAALGGHVDGVQAAINRSGFATYSALGAISGSVGRVNLAVTAGLGAVATAVAGLPNPLDAQIQTSFGGVDTALNSTTAAISDTGSLLVGAMDGVQSGVVGSINGAASAVISGTDAVISGTDQLGNSVTGLGTLVAEMPVSMTSALSNTVVGLVVPQDLSGDVSPIEAEVSGRVPAVQVDALSASTCANPTIAGATIPVCDMVAPISPLLHAATTAALAMALLSGVFSTIKLAVDS